MFGHLSMYCPFLILNSACTYIDMYVYMYICNPLTVHIINISNLVRLEGVEVAEAVTSFIGGGS